MFAFLKSSRFYSVAVGATLLATSLAYAEIHEVKSFREVMPYIDKDTLWVLDIDNTILHPTTPKGSDEYFYYLYHVAGKKPSEDPALDIKINNEWNALQSQIKVQAVESDMPKLLKQKQNEGIKTMALTARTGDIADVSLKQLNSIGVAFVGHTVREPDLIIPKEVFKTADAAFFHQGVLSIGEGNVKGVAFKTFLEKTGFKPKKVVFVDDRLKHVKSMEEAMSKMGIPYIGFRYGARDAAVKAYMDEMTKPAPKM